MTPTAAQAPDREVHSAQPDPHFVAVRLDEEAIGQAGPASVSLPAEVLPVAEGQALTGDTRSVQQAHSDAPSSPPDPLPAAVRSGVETVGEAGLVRSDHAATGEHGSVRPDEEAGRGGVANRRLTVQDGADQHDYGTVGADQHEYGTEWPEQLAGAFQALSTSMTVEGSREALSGQAPSGEGPLETEQGLLEGPVESSRGSSRGSIRGPGGSTRAPSAEGSVEGQKAVMEVVEEAEMGEVEGRDRPDPDAPTHVTGRARRLPLTPGHAVPGPAAESSTQSGAQPDDGSLQPAGSDWISALGPGQIEGAPPNDGLPMTSARWAEVQEAAAESVSAAACGGKEGGGAALGSWAT